MCVCVCVCLGVELHISLLYITHNKLIILFTNIIHKILMCLIPPLKVMESVQTIMVYTIVFLASPQQVQDAESTLPLVGSAESDGVGPSNTKVQPGISNKPLSPDSSLPPGKPSEGTSGNPNGPANGVSIAPPEQRVNQPPVPPLDAKSTLL